MNEITIRELIKIVAPGDVLMTSNPDGLGKYIIMAQEMAGDPAKYTHIAMFGLPYEIMQGMIYEANKTLDIHQLDQYIGAPICVIRHAEMTLSKYKIGFAEIEDNLGEKYPYHRLAFHFIDSCCNWLLRNLGFKYRTSIAGKIHLDFHLCSEWIAGHYKKAGLKIFPKFDKTGGVTPDDFDDARRMYPELWKTIYEGKLTDEAREKIKETNIKYHNQHKEFQTCF